MWGFDATRPSRRNDGLHVQAIAKYLDLEAGRVGLGAARTPSRATLQRAVSGYGCPMAFLEELITAFGLEPAEKLRKALRADRGRRPVGEGIRFAGPPEEELGPSFSESVILGAVVHGQVGEEGRLTRVQARFEIPLDSESFKLAVPEGVNSVIVRSRGRGRRLALSGPTAIELPVPRRAGEMRRSIEVVFAFDPNRPQYEFRFDALVPCASVVLRLELPFRNVNCSACDWPPDVSSPFSKRAMPAALLAERFFVRINGAGAGFQWDPKTRQPAGSSST